MHKISTEHAQILLHTKYQQNTLRYYYTQNINRTRSDIITHKISTEHAQILLHTKYQQNTLRYYYTQNINTVMVKPIFKLKHAVSAFVK